MGGVYLHDVSKIHVELLFLVKFQGGGTERETETETETDRERRLVFVFV